MNPTVVLDTGPLGLLVQRPGVAPAEACRAWLDRLLASGGRAVVPEVADYELRRELIRLGMTSSVVRLDQLIAAPNVRYLALTTPAMRVAAHLWAQARRQGYPTADPHALDADVILAAQTLTAGLTGPFVVATTNVGHLKQFVAAELWSTI